MRKTNPLLLIAIVVITGLVSSCNKDQDTNLSQGNEQLANAQNATEETKIPTSTLETGIEIVGATKETGTPPSPNSNLNFDLNTDLTEAFQGSGLQIEFSSTESIAGAYIQFKDVDGNASSNYFDVSSSSFNKNNGLLTQKVGATKSFSNAKVAQNSNDQIEVDFGSNVPAGQFCYDICLYDASNNVSQIQTVCVTVEAWGGNASIVGEWIFDREEYNNNEETTTINCTNGQTIEVVEYEKSTKYEWTFTLNEDGTYFEVYDEEGRMLDYSTSQSSCSVTYGDIVQGNYRYSGNWAYNEEDETLTVIDFKYEDFLDASKNEDFEDGSLYIEGAKAEVISGQLILSGTDDYGEIFKTYFNRK